MAEGDEGQRMASEGGPRPIVRLEESVVNRIAAGEVIGRPANAVKELLENCLDAGATSVKVSVKDGGAKLLQIQDNGSGIRKEDLPILCERFTTSKIRKYDDLSSLQTYGFRGEALASISHVSHLTVTTKTRSDAVGWKAHFLDGKLVPAQPGASSDPRASASNDGTIISAEDLFYNVPQRRKALGTPSDEYNRILDVVSKYAIHNEGVGISLKKVGSNTSDVVTSASASTLDTIGQLYNETLRKALVRLEVAHQGNDDVPEFQCEGWVSNAHWHAKKSNCMIFINHRLVDCPPLKKALESTYSPILPKSSFPFLYVSLKIAPEHVDPNVHPNKREVRFVGEDEVVDLVCAGVAKVLEQTSGSRTYTVQTLLPGVSGFTQTQPAASTSRSGLSKLPPQKLVRTDPTARTLDSLLSRDTQPQEKRRRVDGDEVGTQAEPMLLDSSDDEAQDLDEVAAVGTAGAAKIAESNCSLTSIRTLRKRVKDRKHNGLDEIVRRHILVGIIDLAKGCSCWQHETGLFYIIHTTFCEELFNQLGLRQFGALPKFKLEPAPPLKRLVEIGVQREWDRRRDPALKAMGLEVAIEKICDTLMSRREMLDEYFSFTLDEDAKIESIPVLLPGYRPNLDKLPLLLMRLAAHVDWDDEIGCFDSFFRELGFFHIPTLLTPNGHAGDGEDESAGEKERELAGQLEHVLFPAMRTYLVPSKEMVNAAVRVTTLPELYRVFERC